MDFRPGLRCCRSVTDKRQPRKKPTQERSKILVGSVVLATESLAREQPILSITMGAIARRAGVSLASVYEYFPTKDAVLAAWAESAWERALHAGFAALEEAIVVRRLPVDEGMGMVITAINGELRPFASASKGLAFHNMVGRSDRRVELYDNVRTIIEGIILGAGDVGRIAVASPSVAARLLATILCADSYMVFLSEGDETAVDREITDLFRRYLRGDAPAV
jgi:AcrR family transcriptional regulator